METVKFRVWNGKEMVYDIMAGKFGIFYVNPEKGDGLNTKDTACLSENTTKYPEGTPLMQFTGLLDRNGKEIYEGDIIKYFQPYANKWDTHIVLWDDKFAGFGMFEFNNEWCKESDWLKIKEIEIIGNIYENSELLNQKGKKK